VVRPPWETRRELLVRVEAETDWSYGSKPEARVLGEHLRLGVINVDKHRGPTSHEVAATVKRMMGLDHAGQSGTLEEAGVIPPSQAFYL